MKRTEHRQSTRNSTDSRSPHSALFNAEAGKLWIAPDLSRQLHGRDGNRGQHTTSAARLLRLAEIALKKSF